MINNPKPKFMESPEAIRDVAYNYRFKINPMDEGAEKAEEFAKQNKQEIIGLLKGNQDFWQCFHEIYDGGFFGTTLEKDGFTIEYCVGFDLKFGNEPLMVMEVISKKWAEERTKEVDEIFNEENLPEGTISRRRFPVGVLAERLKTKPLEDFTFTKEIANPNEIEDRIGMGLDDNIVELISIVNALGLETTMSCGGHQERKNSRPFIHFAGNTLEKLLKLLVLWEKQTKIRYTIVPEDKFASDLRLEPLAEYSLEETQEDFEKLTEFLIEKVGEQYQEKFPIEELRRRLRGEIENVK